MAFCRRFSLYFAWLIALFATVGSLYFSEIKHWIPCPICWYQRVCLFPLVIILGIAAFRCDAGIVRYVLLQVVLGIVLSFFQIVQSRFQLLSIPMCGPEISCLESNFTIGWGITLPLLSLLAFLGIFFFLFMAVAPSMKNYEQ